MDYRNLGRTGLKVSALCLGSMQFGWTADETLSLKILDRAFFSGINFIDTADIYSTWAAGNRGGVAEEIIGRWMRQSAIARDRVIIATKVRGRLGPGPNDEGLSRVHIFNAVEGSLRRLGTDYLDLYQTHSYDAITRIEETLQALDDLVHQGKVRYLGCSNYPAWRLTEALWAAKYHGWSRFCSLQPHYHLLRRAEFERELADVCRLYGLGVLPYSPLAGGFLTGKYRQDRAVDSERARSAQRYFNERNFSLLDQMEMIGEAHANLSISQVALAWLLGDPIITSPIIGPRSLEQLEDNLGAADLQLTQEEREALNQATAWKD